MGLKFIKMKYIGTILCVEFTLGRGAGGGGVLKKALHAEAPPQGPAPPSHIPFLTGKVLLLYIPSIDKWYAFQIPSVRAEPR